MIWKTTLKIISLFTLLAFSQLNYATVLTSVKSGDFSDPQVWDLNQIPTSSDTCIIDGHTVHVKSASAIISQLHIINADNTGDSELIIESDGFLTIMNDCIVQANDVERHVKLAVTGRANLVIESNLHFSRIIDNNTLSKMQFSIDGEGQALIKRNFSFEYKNANIEESNEEIWIRDSASLVVEGSTSLILNDGKDFQFTIEKEAKVFLKDQVNISVAGGKKFNILLKDKSQLDILGEVNINNNGAQDHIDITNEGDSTAIFFNNNIRLISNNTSSPININNVGQNAELHIMQDMTLTSQTDNRIIISLQNTSKMFLGGSIHRPTKFGMLLMDNTAEFIYNGSAPQNLACSKIPGSGNDSFHFTKVSIENTSGMPMISEGEFEVDGEMKLSQGILTSTDTTMIIINSNAKIVGGSKDAYIDGPVVKKGLHPDGFMFPLGDEGRYAPMSITGSNKEDSEYIAQYLSCPPPFGNNRISAIVSITPDQFWELDRNEDAPGVNVTLHWEDISNIGDFEKDSIVVAMYSETEEQWTSIGKETVEGGIGVGESGSITNLLSCPPPFGNTKFTVAAIDRSGSVSTTELNEVQQIELFPNPIKDEIRLQGKFGFNKGALKVYNQSGQLLYNGVFNFEMGYYQIPSSELNMKQNGMYFLHLRNDEDVKVIKAIKTE